MISSQTTAKLLILIQSVCENERKVEMCRHLLCECPKFSPQVAFSRLDRQNNNCLTHSDLHHFFISKNQPKDYADLQMLLKNIDKNKDQRIYYEEFIDFILPKQNDPLKEIVMKREDRKINSNESLEYEIELGLMRVFQQVIANARIYDSLRQDLRIDYDFHPSSCFLLLQDPSINLITLSSLDKIMRLNNKILSENELQAGIMYGDVDGDGCWNEQELEDLLIIGIPAPVQTSPSKRRQSPERNTKEEIIAKQNANTLNQNISPSKVVSRYSGYSPSKIINRQTFSSAYQAQASPYSSQIQNNIIKSPIQSIMIQKNSEDNQQKINDNIKYSQYLQTERENILKMNTSPSRIYKSSYIGNKSYISPSKNTFSSQLRMTAKNTAIASTDELMNLLRKMIQQNQDLQQVINELSLQQDFNLMDAFRLFDTNQNQNISSLEMEKALHKIGVFPTKDQLYLFFKVYALDQNNLLKYSDFAQLFYTQNSSQVSLLKSRKPVYVEPLEGQSEIDIFTFNTRELFKKFLNQVFATETTLDLLREQLQLQPQFNLYEAFKALDLDQDGIISYEELKTMLINYGIHTTENDMINLFTRFDRDKDGKIKYYEFAQEVAPKSPSRYSKY